MITAVDHRILDLLADRPRSTGSVPGVTAFTIANDLGVDITTIRRRVDTLVRLGRVRVAVNPLDRRVRLYRIAPAIPADLP